MPYMIAVRSESGLTFLVRVLFFVFFLICIGNALSIAFGRMDLVSWFTGFTVKDRDSLNLFLFYAIAGAFLLAVAARWYKLLWWLVVVGGVVFFFSNLGKMYFMNNSGPSITETMTAKFNFDNIPKLGNDSIPAEHNKNTTNKPAQLETVNGVVHQTVSQAVIASNAKEWNAWGVSNGFQRANKDGNHIKLTSDQRAWCKNDSEIKKYNEKYANVPKMLGLAKLQCYTGYDWEEK